LVVDKFFFRNGKQLGITDNLEELVPQMASNGNSDWSSEVPGDSIEDESESSSDEDDLFGTSFM